jgi:hypothetical protein
MSREQQESLDRGINLFNDRRYFEAHEEWEHEWRLMSEGQDKAFFQGLIMAAASFYHYVQRECSGAREMLKRSVAYLRAGMEGHPDINVGEFIDDLERLRREFDGCTFNVDPAGLPIIRRSLVNW